MDHYQTLQVGREATKEEIRKAYRRLSRKYHPDNAGEQARERFDRVQEAYAVLGDEEKREAYDRQISSGRTVSGRQQNTAANRKPRGAGENTYADMAAFFSGAYKNSFDQFFHAGMKKEAGKDRRKPGCGKS